MKWINHYFPPHTTDILSTWFTLGGSIELLNFAEGYFKHSKGVILKIITLICLVTLIIDDISQRKKQIELIIGLHSKNSSLQKDLKSAHLDNVTLKKKLRQSKKTVSNYNNLYNSAVDENKQYAQTQADLLAANDLKNQTFSLFIYRLLGTSYSNQRQIIQLLHEMKLSPNVDTLFISSGIAALKEREQERKDIDFLERNGGKINGPK